MFRSKNSRKKTHYPDYKKLGIYVPAVNDNSYGDEPLTEAELYALLELAINETIQKEVHE